MFTSVVNFGATPEPFFVSLCLFVLPRSLDASSVDEKVGRGAAQTSLAQETQQSPPEGTYFGKYL